MTAAGQKRTGGTQVLQALNKPVARMFSFAWQAAAKNRRCKQPALVFYSVGHKASARCQAGTDVFTSVMLSVDALHYCLLTRWTQTAVKLSGP